MKRGRAKTPGQRLSHCPPAVVWAVRIVYAWIIGESSRLDRPLYGLSILRQSIFYDADVESGVDFYDVETEGETILRWQWNTITLFSISSVASRVQYVYPGCHKSDHRQRATNVPNLGWEQRQNGVGNRRKQNMCYLAEGAKYPS